VAANKRVAVERERAEILGGRRLFGAAEAAPPGFEVRPLSGKHFSTRSGAFGDIAAAGAARGEASGFSLIFV
jgi:hypothetical protein